MLQDLFLPLYKKGYTDTMIAKELNLSNQTIGRFRHSLNLPKRTINDKYSSYISELVSQDLSDSEIGNQIGLCRHSVGRIRRKLHLPVCSKTTINLNYTNQDRIKSRIIAIAKYRAIKNNLNFNIKLADIELPEYCSIMNTKLEYKGNTRGNPNSASLDRIDNSKGYIKDNIQVISLHANTMKSNANFEQLSVFCNNILKMIELHSKKS